MRVVVEYAMIDKKLQVIFLELYGMEYFEILENCCSSNR